MKIVVSARNHWKLGAANGLKASWICGKMASACFHPHWNALSNTSSEGSKFTGDGVGWKRTSQS
jgi:hypothetical protein